jgi:prepilin-type N-terminal cleavage/methylation domain-containing protein
MEQNRKLTHYDGETANANRGFSLIELLIAIAVIAVVSAMLVQLLAASARFYRKTISISQLQKSSQMISRRMENAIMNAHSLYEGDTSAGYFLYMGSDACSETKENYQGSVLFLDKNTHCLYYRENGQIPAGTEGEKGKLTVSNVKKALEGTDDTKASKEYLLSTNVDTLSIRLPDDLSKSRTVTYQLTLKHVSGIQYSIMGTAAPRNTLLGVWRKDG